MIRLATINDALKQYENEKQMGIYILTSRFANGFYDEVADVLRKVIRKTDKFVFIASEFEKMHEKTDYYFRY